jgi:hypothetical protein
MGPSQVYCKRDDVIWHNNQWSQAKFPSPCGCSNIGQLPVLLYRLYYGADHLHTATFVQTFLVLQKNNHFLIPLVETLKTQLPSQIVTPKMRP